MLFSMKQPDSTVAVVVVDVEVSGAVVLPVTVIVGTVNVTVPLGSVMVGKIVDAVVVVFVPLGKIGGNGDTCCLTPETPLKGLRLSL
jgi:hypothetical protein